MYKNLTSRKEFLIKHSGLTIPHPMECLNISISTKCSLTCKFCAYPYSTIPRQIMSDELFKTLIDKAVIFGYRVFNLTPLIGEVLLDPGIINKITYLDNHPGVKFYFFSTNLTHADENFFSVLKDLKKLRWFSVSLYGQNHEDYHKITGASKDMFESVVDNLHKMYATDSFSGRSEIKVRTPGSQKALAPLPQCVEILDKLQQHGTQIRYGVRIMNWGGLVKKNDMDELDLDYKSVEKRSLPCVFLFHKPSVLPDGTVTACSCGDAHAKLSIGNIIQQSFSDVFSLSNKKYIQILNRHMAGEYSAPCNNCSGYRPLDQQWYSYQYYDRNFVSLQSFFDWLSNNMRQQYE